MESSNWDSFLHFVSDTTVDLNMQDHDASEASMTFTPNLQILTPPLSEDGSPICDDLSDNLVSISTTFGPDANIYSLPPDLVLLSTDSVLFYVHAHVLRAASDNAFQSLIPTSSFKDSSNLVVHISETSPMLNIILHAIYNMSCSQYSPSFDALSSAVNRLPMYGVHPNTHIGSSSPLHHHLLSHAPLFPLNLYTLAAKYDLDELAVSTSPHLLSFQLSSLTDEMVEEMGPKYLRRLVFLHVGRIEALKRLLIQPPHPHAPTPSCDFTDQKTVTRAWALASAYLVSEIRPDLSTGFLESTLTPLAERISCDLCKQCFKDRIKNLVIQWSAVKRTV